MIACAANPLICTPASLSSPCPQQLDIAIAPSSIWHGSGSRSVPANAVLCVLRNQCFTLQRPGRPSGSMGAIAAPVLFRV